MVNPPTDDPYLLEAVRVAGAQYELIPWMDRLWQPQELTFRPLPDNMLDLLRASADFTMPGPGQPTLLNLAAENGDAGMLVYLHPMSGELYAMVPVAGAS
jgi:hypothetical protein